MTTPVPAAEETPAAPVEESKEVATESKDLPVETKEEIPAGKYYLKWKWIPTVIVSKYSDEISIFGDSRSIRGEEKQKGFCVVVSRGLLLHLFD